MKRFRQIVEARGSTKKPVVRTKTWPLRIKTKKPKESDRDVQDRLGKESGAAWDEYDKHIREGKLKNWAIDWEEKHPRFRATNDDLRKAWLRGLRVSKKAKKVLPDDELKKMDAEKDKTIAKIKALREAKKWKPGEGWRKLRAAKKAAKAAPPKKKAKPVAKKVEKPVTTRVDDKHPLEHILKNENKDLRAKLMQVHPADRGRVQKLIANPEKANAFMRGEIPFRKK